MPRRAEPDPALPLLALVGEARDAGLSIDQIRHRVRSGAWLRIARGAYVPGGEAEFDALDRHARARVEHLLQAVAAASRNPGSVICDASAATLHGMALLDLPARVQLGVPPGRWSGTRSGIDFRTRDFAPDEVVRGRVPVASALRAWLDLTRHGTLADALAAGDSAVRQGLLDPRAAVERSAEWAGRRGCRRLARAADLLNGARESVLESASFAYFVEHRLPLPRCQVVIRSRDGLFLGRVDFLWEEARLVGECDGRIKYASVDDVYAEKRREDAIRAEEYQFVRWGMRDLRNPALAELLRRRLRRDLH